MPDSLQSQVERVHRRVIGIDRVRMASTLALALLVAVAVTVGIDSLIRWPMAVRLAILLALLAAAVRATRTVVDRGWLRAPGASSVALRIERVEPTLAGTLASAYEFERSGESARSGLALATVEQASRRWSEVDPARHVRARAALGLAGAALLAASMWLAFAFLQPGAAIIGLRRTLTPWTGDQWPARVALQAEVGPTVIARGSSVPMRVRVTRGDDAGLRVRAICEATGGGAAAEREFDLARQPDGSYERPIVAEGDRMRVRFVAGDGETDPIEIAVVSPPSIERGTIEVMPPAYAANDHPAFTGSWQGVALPDVGSVLAGSSIRLGLDLGAPAPSLSMGAVEAFHDRGEPMPPPTVSIEGGRRWNITWVAAASGEIVVRPADAQGVKAPESLRVAVRVTADNEPTVSVTDPEADEVVTVEAIIPFRVEARDDLGLASIGWRLDRQQRSGEPAPVSLRESMRASTVREDSVAEQLSLPSVQAKVGDTLLLRGVARDRLERDGQAITMSDVRKLRVVERDAFERQVRQQVAGLRQAAARLEASQQEIAREADAAAASRSQAGLGERVHQGNEAARRITQRLRRNGLSDLPLTETLQEAARLGEQAERDASRAQDALREAANGSPQAMPRAREAQKSVETALREMVDLLDRDDDAAAAQRRADRLAEGIARLRQELREAARPSAGKSPDELTPQEREAMQEQAAKQRTAADEAAAMIDDLRARAQRLEGKDRSQSRSLQQAADEGERGQASRRMDEAADRTDRNQATAADEAMQAAAEAVDRMRDALREDRRARTEDLKRRLASLVETLRALLGEGEAALREIDTPGDATATRLLRLARNTVAAAEEARAGDRSLLRAVGSIDRAAERFEASVGRLRAQPADGAGARDAASRGVDLLREALQSVEQAQRREREKAAERERVQLERQYRELAVQVRSVREATAGTLPPAGGRLDRRGAAVQREQGQRLQGVQRAFDDGPKASETVRDTETFRSIHARIDRDLASARTSLDAMTGDASTVRRLDLVADAFEALAGALADPEEPEDPFADAANQGQQGGGAGSGGDEEAKLPPLTELKLVRNMQQQVLQRTRTLDEARSAGVVVDAEMADLAAMQEEVRRLGEDWIRRMEERRASRKAPKPERSPTTRPTDAFGMRWSMPDDAPKPADTTTQPVTPPASPSATTPPPANAPKTLDELLGIGGTAAGTDEAARMQRERQLQRSLNEEDLTDLGKAAAESMQVATTLVRDRRETGLGTQRAQRQAVENLDALIDGATRFDKQQKQQKQQKGSKGDSQRKPSGGKAGGEDGSGQPQPSGSPQQDKGERDESRPRGQAGDQVDPPPPEDAAMAANGTLVEGRSEWGRLPQRIREIMSQARRDRISAIYQQATEAYYRRLAEERGP